MADNTKNNINWIALITAVSAFIIKLFEILGAKDKE